MTIGHAYPCFCTPDKLEKTRQEQMKQKENPHYDGTCRTLSPDEATKKNGERRKLTLFDSKCHMKAQRLHTIIYVVTSPLKINNSTIMFY
ncbi:MAG: hypothetical protein HC797_02070 [Anaerolineales bacterium]|nr:hypothetical protein [Anaerolineales bacterium]